MSFTKTEWAELKARFLDRMAVVGSATVVARELGINRGTAGTWVWQAALKSKRIPHPKKAEYLALRKAGHSQASAAQQVGVHVRTCRDWDYGTVKLRNGRHYADGQVLDYTAGEVTIGDVIRSSPSSPLAAVERPLHPRFLTIEDRERIADLRRDGHSLRVIGRRLGRPASTIKREIDQHPGEDGSYGPFAAHREAAEQRPRPKPAKLAVLGRLRDYVVSKLALQWSPEQISNTLKVGFPTDESMRVSTETIYQAIYVQARGGLKREIVDALRTGRA